MSNAHWDLTMNLFNPHWRQIWAGTEHQFTRLPEITYVWRGSLGEGGTAMQMLQSDLVFSDFQSLWIKSTVSMQLRTMQYYTISCNTMQFDLLTKHTIVLRTPFLMC